MMRIIRTAAGLGLDRHPAGMNFGYYEIGDAQAQTGADADRLGREKGSNTRLRVASSMPGPLSSISMQTMERSASGVYAI